MIPPDALLNQSSAPNRAIVNAAVGLWQTTSRRHWLDASGTSMLPLIHHGDRLLVDHGPFAPRRGDIVLFRQESGLLAHRIVSIKQRCGTQRVITKGDNVGWFDRPLPAADLLGRVVAISHGGSTIRLDTPWPCAVGWVLAHYTNSVAAVFHLSYSRSSRLFATFRLPYVTVALAHTLLRLFLRLPGEPPP